MLSFDPQTRTDSAAAVRLSADEPARDRSRLDQYFSLTDRRTTIPTEIVAGATTFVAAAYLTVVIPNILASGHMDRAAVTTSTIMMFVAGTLGMALYARLPFVVG